MSDKVCYEVWLKNHYTPVDVLAYDMRTEGGFVRFDVEYEIKIFYPLDNIEMIKIVPVRE